MKTRLLVAGATLGLACLAGGGAMASDTTATFTSYTGLSDPIPGSDLLTIWGSSAPAPPGGETIATAQGDGDLTLADTTDFTLVGNPDSGEARVVQGDDGDSAAPFMPDGAKDTAPYLSIMGGEGAGTATRPSWRRRSWR